MKTFHLTAWIDTAEAEAIDRGLREISQRRKIIPTDKGYFLKATVRGSDARLLNKRLLASLRKIDPHTALHAEWKSETSTVWFFNYLKKRSRKSGLGASANPDRASSAVRHVNRGQRTNSTGGNGHVGRKDTERIAGESDH